MALPAPNLDDRTFHDLVEEAKRRIAARCPQWTDFNASDPGMTLVEVMAWLAETALYRMNRVPDRNYVKFLELIGVHLRPAQPARAWITCTANRTDVLRRGTRFSAPPTDGGEPLEFRSIRDAAIANWRLLRAVSLAGDHELSWDAGIGKDGLRLDAAAAGHDDVFAGRDVVEHFLYLGDSGILGPMVHPGLRLHLDVAVAAAGAALGLEWEAWDGDAWVGLELVADGTSGLTENGRITLQRLPPVVGELAPRDVTRRRDDPDQPAQWIRARLATASADQMPRVHTLSGRLELPRPAVVPTRVVTSHEIRELPTGKDDQVEVVTIPGQEVDPTLEFRPFGARPRKGYKFHIESPWFARPGTRIELELELTPASGSGSVGPVRWLYRDRDQRWATLNVEDETKGLTAGGVVRFTVPDDIAPWKGAGSPGTFVHAELLDPPSGVAVRGPTIEAVRIGFLTAGRAWRHVIRENYGTREIVRPGELEPFDLRAHEDPAFYLAFDTAPAGIHQVLFDFAVPKTRSARAAAASMSDARWAHEKGSAVSLAVHYHDGSTWQRLPILRDDTRQFRQTGSVEFEVPRDWAESIQLGTRGHWLRISRRLAPRDYRPRLGGILLNTVEVEQVRLLERRLTVTSEPNQRFSLGRSVTEELTVLVREPGSYSVEETLRAAAERGKLIEFHEGSHWMVWQRVMNFFESGPGDQHYVLDAVSGTIQLGDGVHGALPPAGARDVRVHAGITAGARGNVDAHRISVLDSDVPSIDRVTNHIPAGGGADAETLENAKLRGPWELRHRDRAVTAEDFQKLAELASPLVHRAHCFAENGTVHLIIVPASPEPRPTPSQYLLRTVGAYVRERCLINTKVEVHAPAYLPIDFDIEVVLEPEFVRRAVEVEQAIDRALRAFFHPATGAPDRRGWPLGRSVHISEIYYVLEDLDGVEVVDRVSMQPIGERGERQDRHANRVPLPADAFPVAASIRIEARIS